MADSLTSSTEEGTQSEVSCKGKDKGKARVTFAGPTVIAEERTPLLSSLEGEEEDSGKLFGLYNKSKKSALLPLHRRARHSVNLRSLWRHLALVTSGLVFLGCIVIAFAVFDKGTHRLRSHLNSQSPIPIPRNRAYLIRAQNGAAATENIDCSNIAVDVLKDGGNAVDAAIAATFCIGVIAFYSSGIGGGGFMTVRVPAKSSNDSSEVFFIDFRETAPAGSNSTMFAHNPITSKIGGLSVGVPGELRGLQEAYRRWGRLPWARLVQPSVDLAASWSVGREMAKRIQLYAPLMYNHPDWKPIFAPNGKLLVEGDIMRRSALSKTLATIAKDGSAAFYKGPIAEALLAKVRSTGGILTQSDLDDYKIRVGKAFKGTYRDKLVYTTNAPTSGPVLQHMFNILEHYHIAEEGFTPLNSHRLVEILKFGFAARTRLSDMVFRNDSSIVDKIRSKSFGNAVFKNLTDGTTHTTNYYRPEFDVKIDHGTSHTSVLDKDGMAVSLTSTVNLIFGSQVLDPVTGILLNDEMDDFATPGEPNHFGLYPSPWNYPEPGKRPLSSTTPIIMEHADGSFYLAAGGSGGSRIFGAVFQVMANLEWGMDVSKAIEFGRVHDQLLPAYVDVDNVYPPENIYGLKERRHNVTVADVNRIAAIVQAVVRTEDGRIFAASDSRKNGIAAGY